MNIMLASITERTREIGIRRALGAKRRHITLQFLVETTVISLTGGLIGIALGILGRHAAADGRATAQQRHQLSHQHHDMEARRAVSSSAGSWGSGLGCIRR